MPLNIQQPEPLVSLTSRTAGRLDVFKVWSTIQGEGPLIGTPSVFVRLAGCNIRCPLCDTDYTSVRAEVEIPDLLKRITSLQDRVRLVVLTGGEPFRQSISELVVNLIVMGIEVQIETNGTIYREDFPYGHRLLESMCSIVCSPKSSVVEERLIPHISDYKYVVDADHIDPEDGLPVSVLGRSGRVARPPHHWPLQHIFVQPADEMDEEKNARNLKAAVDSCMRHGYRLGVQIHKQLGME